MRLAKIDIVIPGPVRHSQQSLQDGEVGLKKTTSGPDCRKPLSGQPDIGEKFKLHKFSIQIVSSLKTRRSCKALRFAISEEILLCSN